MFKRNKYFKTYKSIIRNVQSQNRNRINGYYEEHHIIPRSIGGSDFDYNLVLLTPREHFICHRLLTKFQKHDKNTRAMFCALNFMCITNTNKTISSSTYSFIRHKFSESISGDNHHSRGPLGPVWKENVSNGVRRSWENAYERKQALGEKNRQWVKDNPERAKEIQLKAAAAGGRASKGRVFSDEHKRKISEGQIGKIVSEKQRLSLGKAAAGRKWLNKDGKNTFAKAEDVQKLLNDNWEFGKKHKVKV
jgi:hypothetical protein